ncbi:MAG TPA: response regulator [Terriglobales bacterium]|nr:response regulator [Terriglobales bacterium]
MATSTIRVLVVDDYEPWRRFVSSTLRKQPQLQVIAEVWDGSEAVQQAQQLQPDLIVLDIGLPSMNGIEAARRIRELSPRSKILFVSENRCRNIAREALCTGAGGYVVKSDAASDLLPAVEAVLQGKPFFSVGLASRDSSAPMNDHGAAITRCHEVAFYADDTSVVDGYARFIESALKIGHAVIVVVTPSHRASLVPRLEADGVDVAAAIEQGSYIPLDAADTLSKLTVNDMPDPVRCVKVVGNLIMGAAKGVKGEGARVLVCGEIAPTLLSKGNAEGSIKLEHLWDEITRGYGVHTLCGYLWSAFPHHENDPVFQRICEEHSGFHGRELGY